MLEIDWFFFNMFKEPCLLKLVLKLEIMLRRPYTGLYSSVVYLEVGTEDVGVVTSHMKYHIHNSDQQVRDVCHL